MRFVEKLLGRLFHKGRNNSIPASAEVACSVNNLSADAFWNKVNKSEQVIGYSRITRDNGACIFYRIDEENEDMSVIELITPKGFGETNAEDEIGSMGEEFTSNGVEFEETRKRRIALVIVTESDSSSLREQIQKMTFEDPIGFPPGTCYNLAICAYFDPISGMLYCSKKAELLKREWVHIENEVQQLINALAS